MIKRYLSSLVLTFAAVVAIGETVFAEDFIFETAEARYVISDSGVSKSLQEKRSSRELLVGPPAPFATLRKGGKYFPVTHVRRMGEFLHADFGQSGISADYRITAGQECVVIELARMDGAGVEEIRLAQLRIGGLANAGALLTVSWNEQFAVSLMGLSGRVDSRFGEGMLLSSVYPEYGLLGEKVALVAVPTPNFMETVEKIERRFQLPSPRIGGSWAKMSPDVRSSYLFTDLTEANADETIRFAKMAGFKYIMIYSHTWSSSLGSYPINTTSFPRGEESLKAVIEKCHAAGLKVGMHMLTSFVSKNDALVRGRSVPLLASDAEAVLATDIDEKTTEIVARGALTHFPGMGPSGPSKDVRVDDEIIHYEVIGGAGSTTLMQCTRGYAGTRAAIHSAGSKIHHLVEFEGSYLANLKTPLKDEIAERIAGLINRCGFDMVYFDGGEVNCINGPCWYWAGQQQMSVWNRVKRDLLVQGSGITHWTWHMFARGVCDDFAAVAPKQYLDYHKIADEWQFHTRSFLPAELGWWGFLASAPDHPATTPDEVEYYAVRMLALNSPVSLETSLAALKANGRTEEMLRLLGEYEQLRLSDAVPSAVRNRLRSGEWHMNNKNGRPEFQPVRYDARRVDVPGEVLVRNEFGPQKFKFRLQAAPKLTKPGDRSNITLLRSDSPLILNPPAPYVVTSGTLVGRTEFTKPVGAQAGIATAAPAAGGPIQKGGSLDLSTHRALAVRLKIDGPLPKAGTPGAVLNVQLECGGRTYRDHYIDLDFLGERTVIIPEPNTERMLPEFRPAHANYVFKKAMYGFNYRDVVAVNFRWMRQPIRPVKCTIMLVEALAETESVLKNPEISVGATKIVFPVTLKTGEYLEFWGEGPARVFDRNGVQLSTVQIPNQPVLSAGDNTISLSMDGAASAKLTTISLGEPLTF